MLPNQTGALLRQLRGEQNLTQKELADRIGVSDKAVSKWERGAGLPDVSLVGVLAQTLGVPAERLLAGELAPNTFDGGNMKRLAFYRCPTCGNVLTATTASAVSCCGRTLEAMQAQPCDDAHRPQSELIENEWFLTLPHEMTKAHHLLFAAAVGYDRLYLIRLYPEQDAAVRLPRIGRGKLFIGCSRDGLFVLDEPKG